jgi:hypothetical protein
VWYYYPEKALTNSLEDVRMFTDPMEQYERKIEIPPVKPKVRET